MADEIALARWCYAAVAAYETLQLGPGGFIHTYTLAMDPADWGPRDRAIAQATIAARLPGCTVEVTDEAIADEYFRPDWDAACVSDA